MSNLPRGIYEKVPGSKIYWIRYVDATGKLHREKDENLSTVNSLLAIRRTAKLNGKLPEATKAKRLPFSELIDDAIQHSKSENDKPVTHGLEVKMKRIRPAFGGRAAESINRRIISKRNGNAFGDGAIRCGLDCGLSHEVAIRS